MSERNFSREELADGILRSDLPLIYGVINTANYDVMGYGFHAMESPDGLRDLGFESEDVDKADKLPVGGSCVADWLTDGAVVVVKIKDSRDK